MIAVLFDRPIPVGLTGRRENIFRADQGWMIAEVEPGRLHLDHTELGAFEVEGIGYVVVYRSPSDSYGNQGVSSIFTTPPVVGQEPVLSPSEETQPSLPEAKRRGRGRGT